MTTIGKLNEVYTYLNWLDYINAVLPPELHVTENEPIMKSVVGIKLQIAHWPITLYGVLFIKLYKQQQTKQASNDETPVSVSHRKDSQSPLLFYTLNETSRQAVIDMVEHIRHAFIQIISNVTWMDSSTREKAIKKAENIVAHVGYPTGLYESHILHEHYGLLQTMEPNNYFKNSLRLNISDNNHMFNSLRRPANRTGQPNVANAFYQFRDNAIQLPVAILHEKFFSVDRPNYINYASLGNTVGHEITHLFDDDGRKYDLNGNEFNWWNSKSEDKFIENAECFVNQYNRYKDVQTNIKVDGYLTKNENIADNGGVRAAYLAYQHWIERNGQEQQVTGIKYNQKQLFWISYAQAEGGDYGEESLIDIFTSGDAHAPDEFRIRGVVENSEEFAKDFNCPVGTNMNPRYKSRIW